MAAAGLAAELVETALTFAPFLEDIPVLGRILLLFAPGGGDDIKAMEQLQAAALKKKQDRDTRIKKNARYVLKASDAMQCVEDTIDSGTLLLALGKALVNTVAGRAGGGTFPDLLSDKIFSCIESKVLSQKSRRVRKDDVYFGRPAKGHGTGRKRI